MSLLPAAEPHQCKSSAVSRPGHLIGFLRCLAASRRLPVAACYRQLVCFVTVAMTVMLACGSFRWAYSQAVEAWSSQRLLCL